MCNCYMGAADPDVLSEIESEWDQEDVDDSTDDSPPSDSQTTSD